MAYSFLSDPITVQIVAPDNVVGRNVTYKVLDNTDGTLLYTGSFYATGNVQVIYLNDILFNINDNYEWFRNPVTKTITNSPHKTNIKIVFDYDSSIIFSNILHVTRVPNKEFIYYKPIEKEEQIISFNNWGTGVLPRIPLVNHNIPKLFMAVMVNYPKSLLNNNTHLSLDLYDNNTNEHITQLDATERLNETGYSKYLFDGQFFDMMIADINTLGVSDCHIGITALPTMGTTKHCDICRIDSNPADYYVMWINRVGAWQSQPLCAKYEMKEKLTTDNIVTVLNETIPYSKTSEYSWTLNSHWLTYAEHDEFESLLTSKYVYLYNTKTNEGHYVTVTDSNWTFKDNANTKKPFNLTLNVTKSVKQNIIY